MDSDDPIESSSPPHTATYVTQPTQPLVPANPRISDIVIPASSSPDHRNRQQLPYGSNMNNQQKGIFNMMAPPGTFLNVPAKPPPPAANFSQSQRLPIQLDSDSDDQRTKKMVVGSDSEDELGRDDDDIPPARVVQPTKPVYSFDKYRYNNTSQTSSSSTSQDSINPKLRMADFFLEQKVNKIHNVMPHISRDRIIQALKDKRGNEHDATDLLFAQDAEEEERPAKSKNVSFASSAGSASTSMNRGIAQKPQPINRVLGSMPTASQPKPKPLMKRTLDGPKSMTEKYHKSRVAEDVSGDELLKTSPVMERQPKKRRLVRGFQRQTAPTPSPDRDLMRPGSKNLAPDMEEDNDEVVVIRSKVARPTEELVVKKKKIQLSKTDLDSDVSDMDQESSTDPEMRAVRKRDLLKFLNTCSSLELADLAAVPESDATEVISHRPFRSLAQIRRITDANDIAQAEADAKKKRRGKARRVLGERIVDVSELAWAGFTAIDRMMEDCRKLNRVVRRGMEKLNLNTNGTEIEATELTSREKRVDSVFSVMMKTTATTSVPPGFIGTPKIMSKDIELKDYQLVGLNWMHLLWSNDISAILADDMGLGKTCQVISFISHLYTLGKKGPHLVIVPSSTLENWVREFNRFSPELELLVYHGSESERAELKILFEDTRDEVNVVVTTYEMAKGKKDRKFLRKEVKPSTVIFDEGHMLKNKDSERYKAMMEIAGKCWRLLLTGTPLQNNLRELISILGFIMPHIFEDNEEDLDYIFQHRAKTTDTDATALLSNRRIGHVREMMAPFILRRKKDQVLKHLPPKTCRVEYCELTLEQKTLYDDHIQARKDDMAARAAGEHTDQRNWLMELRKAAMHPLLFRQHYDEDLIPKIVPHVPRKGKYRGWSDEKMEDGLYWMSDYQIHQLCHEFGIPKLTMEGEPWMQNSGKVIKLVELLNKNIKDGERTLVFSQFTTMLDILESVLDSAGITFVRLDGSTPVAMRQEYIDVFHRDESIKVFMLSTKSGGTGINLACATKVIIFDSSFNPQEDVQAENRAHRVGQTREVEVVRLVTRGTVEEAIWALGQNKLALDQMVHNMDGTGNSKAKAGNSDAAMEKAGAKLVEKMLEEGKLEGIKTESIEMSEVEGERSSGKFSGSSSEALTSSSSSNLGGSVSGTDVSGAATPIDGKHDGNGENVDMKDMFLNGLKKAGVNVVA